MSGISPNYDDWRQLASIKVWEIAALIHGFDPRAGADVAVKDYENPDSPYGIAPDLSWEIRTLISAVEAGHLITAPAGVIAPNDETGILITSLVSWLYSRGDPDLTDLAGNLDILSLDNEPTAATSPVPSNGTVVVWTPERKLEAKNMRDRAKANGVKAYAANTAKYFDVTPTRLREVLSDKTKKSEVKKSVSEWHPPSR